MMQIRADQVHIGDQIEVERPDLGRVIVKVHAVHTPSDAPDQRDVHLSDGRCLRLPADAPVDLVELSIHRLRVLAEDLGPGTRLEVPLRPGVFTVDAVRYHGIAKGSLIGVDLVSDHGGVPTVFFHVGDVIPVVSVPPATDADFQGL